MTPFAHESEEVFAQYLDKHHMKYEREVKVEPGDVDFKVYSGEAAALCDVKAVVQPPMEYGRVEAQKQIRRDFRSLRKKFGQAPELPCVLVTMNYSTQLFTGITIRTAMFGTLAVEFRITEDDVQTSPMRHKGSAGLTAKQNTSISGILVIDYHGGDCYFHNPYARIPLPKAFFCVAAEFSLEREDEFALNDPQFFPHTQWL